MINKKIIFILGHARSGTTLLNKVLSAHPNIHFINDEFNDFPFFYLLDKKYNKYHDKKYYKLSEAFFNHPRIKQEFTHVDTDNFRGFIDKIFDYYRKTNKKNIIGVKITNDISPNVEMIKSIFPDAYCIHIIRDPRDVFLSLKKVSFGPASPFYAGKSWRNASICIASLKNYVENYHSLKYEDLITAPGKELKKICNFLKTPFSKEMFVFHEKINNTSEAHKLLKQGFVKNNFNKWKKELTRDELNSIYAGTKEEIYKKNYIDKCPTQKISIIKRLREYVYDKIFIYTEANKWDRPVKRYLSKVAR